MIDSTSGDGVALGRLGQVAVPVRDLDRAVDFYRDRLGVPFLFRVPELAFFACDGVRLMLSRPERPEDDHPGSVLYFRVDDLPAAHRVLSARGVRFLDDPHPIAAMPDHDLWMAFFADGEGNTHALMSEVPRR
jgi:catechol 2,3-dioxygenase-like lactoylglutathione lyase family enzyme